MARWGQKRRFERLPLTSGLPLINKHSEHLPRTGLFGQPCLPKTLNIQLCV
jgi:hypothetical protein